MDEEIGRVRKFEKKDTSGGDYTCDIVVALSEYKGIKGLNVREFVSNSNYTGYTKAGTKIPAEQFRKFKELINSIDESEFEEANEETDGTAF